MQVNKDDLLEALRTTRLLHCAEAGVLISDSSFHRHRSGQCKCDDDSQCKLFWALIRVVNIYNSRELSDIASYGRTFPREDK